VQRVFFFFSLFLLPLLLLLLLLLFAAKMSTRNANTAITTINSAT
jgi:hypothetical protein